MTEHKIGLHKVLKNITINQKSYLRVGNASRTQLDKNRSKNVCIVAEAVIIFE